jgi:hypothetical protein
MSTSKVQHLTVTINRAPTDVYAFASDPENISKWAAGLASSTLRRDGDVWLADSPMGAIRIRFTPPNAYGVLDHDVTLPSGDTVHNAMRVIPNGTGSEVTFSLFQRAMSADELARDAAAVTRDLEKLRTLLDR